MRRSVIDREYALDHAAEHGLRFGLAPAQRIGEIDQIAAHLVHRARQCADLQRRHLPGCAAEKSPRPMRSAISRSATTGRASQRP